MSQEKRPIVVRCIKLRQDRERGYMKQQLSIGLAVFMLASTVLATNARGGGPNAEGQSARERREGKTGKNGERPQTSAAGTTNHETVKVGRSSQLSQFAGIGPHSTAIDQFAKRDITIDINKPGADGKPSIEKFEFKGEEVLKDLEKSQAKLTEVSEINSLRESGIKQSVELVEMVERRFAEIPGSEQLNSEALKFVRDYAKALNDPRSTAADLQGYALTAKAMLDYATSNPRAFLAEVYEKGVDAGSRKRQKDCLEG
jgi:hypothetical protein